ncbi:hypothetical protein ACTFIV_003474 [Dictyostelium citrinum]
MNSSLPLIIIKKIILHLIRYKKKKISNLFFLSKSIQSFIIKQIEVLSFKRIKSFEQFRNDLKYQINNQITEIEIKNEILESYKYDDFYNSNNNKKDCFKSLATVYLNFGRNPNNNYYSIIGNASKYNGYLLKIKSNLWQSRLYDEEMTFSKPIFDKIIKIKLTGDLFTIHTAKNLFKKPHLQSIDITLSTHFYSISDWDIDDWQDIDYLENLRIKDSIKEFEESASTNQKLKTLSLRELYYSSRTYRHKKENYKIFINQSIPSILSSPFSNISKFCLYGFLLPNEYSIFDYLSTVKIKKLKIVDVIGLDGNWLNFINYCQKNQSLKQLSIRGNSIEDKDNLFSNLILNNNNKTSSSSSLSKLDISHNFFNLQLILESILSKYYQFSKLIISDSNILPFNMLLSNADKLLSHYDEGGNSHLCVQYRIESKKKKITLTPSLVQNFKESFYSIIGLSEIVNLDIK